MSRAARLWLCLTILGSASACRRESAHEGERQPGGAESAAPLDGMQLSSARRVALESAVEAMQRGDLQRLEQLRVWVQKRAQVVIFEPDDLESLELSIACLQHGSAPSTALERLSRVKSGKLKEPARQLCSRKPP